VNLSVHHLRSAGVTFGADVPKRHLEQRGFVRFTLWFRAFLADNSNESPHSEHVTITGASTVGDAAP
jgi:hypothetical protein